MRHTLLLPTRFRFRLRRQQKRKGKIPLFSFQESLGTRYGTSTVEFSVARHGVIKSASIFGQRTRMREKMRQREDSILALEDSRPAVDLLDRMMRWCNAAARWKIRTNVDVTRAIETWSTTKLYQWVLASEHLTVAVRLLPAPANQFGSRVVPVITHDFSACFEVRVREKRRRFYTSNR